MKYITVYTLLVLIAVVFFPVGNTKAEQDIPKVDISATPVEREIIVDKMIPGDWATRTISIKNNGDGNIAYQMTSDFSSGSKKFYNVLDLKVSIEEDVIFDGLLKDFQGFSNRLLALSENENVQIRIDFPFDSGNEYQGLSTTVKFEFLAEAHSQGIVSSHTDRPSEPHNNGSHSAVGFLPQTGESSPFLFYIIGGLLVILGTYLFSKKDFIRTLIRNRETP